LIVVCRYLGDVLLATPLAQSLRMAGYEVDWIVSSGTEAILENQDYANRVSVIGPDMTWLKQCSLGIKLWRQYDLAFAMPSNDRSMLLSLSASAEVSALINAGRRQDAWKRRMARHWLDFTPGTHMVSLACALAEANRLPVCRDVRIQWSEADTDHVFSALPWQRDERFIHLHPFARWPYKWWRKSAWRELIDSALQSGLRVAITGSPAEQQSAQELAHGFESTQVHVVAGKLNWQQLACLAHHASAYVGLDTANTHLAAATDTPVITLFGPTDPRIWGPWPNGFAGHSPWDASSPNGIQRQGNISLMQGQQHCVPCQLEGCDKRQDSVSLCLKEMQAQWVWQEIESRMLASENSHDPSALEMRHA